MDLNGIVSGYVASVNPQLKCSLQRSLGYSTDESGNRAPYYDVPIDLYLQAQALQYNDLMQISGMNIQGKKLAMYIEGDWEGLVRSDNKGGDLITLPDGTVWLCTLVLENWSASAGWTKICAVLQNGS